MVNLLWVAYEEIFISNLINLSVSVSDEFLKCPAVIKAAVKNVDRRS